MTADSRLGRNMRWLAKTHGEGYNQWDSPNDRMYQKFSILKGKTVASISKDKYGGWIVQFTGSDNRRRTLRLGKISERMADRVKGHVEDLNSAKIIGQSVERRTAVWVADLDDKMLDKLAAVELIEPRASKVVVTLGQFLDEYVAGRVDVKPATQEVWGQVVRNLKDHFGVLRGVDTISEGDADGFKLYLLGEALAPTTVQKRLQFARMFFRAAMRQKLIASNPFAEVSSKAAVRQDRQRYVTREETDRLLEACDPTWRAIVALARYGGLRCPSEVLSVRWRDVDWRGGKLLVTSPKTAHHEGKGSRVIPLYPELRIILSECQAIAPEGTEYIVAGYREQALTAKGWRNCNLRTQFNRILKRAGLKPWPRLFHALRASRETELAKDYPLHVVTAWLGNTPKIAMKHYLMTTEEDFRAAAGAAAGVGNESQEQEIPADSTHDSANFAELCGSMPDCALTLSGAEGIRTLDI
jgi:integrase